MHLKFKEILGICLQKFCELWPTCKWIYCLMSFFSQRYPKWQKYHWLVMLWSSQYQFVKCLTCIKASEFRLCQWFWSQSYQILISLFFFRFLLLSLAILKYRHYFLWYKHSSLAMKNRKNLHFTRKKVWLEWLQV